MSAEHSAARFSAWNFESAPFFSALLNLLNPSRRAKAFCESPSNMR